MRILLQYFSFFFRSRSCSVQQRQGFLCIVSLLWEHPQLWHGILRNMLLPIAGKQYHEKVVHLRLLGLVCLVLACNFGIYWWSGQILPVFIESGIGIYQKIIRVYSPQNLRRLWCSKLRVYVRGDSKYRVSNKNEKCATTSRSMVICTKKPKATSGWGKTYSGVRKRRWDVV